MSVSTVDLLLLPMLLTALVEGLEPGKDKQDFESIEEVRPHEETPPTEPEPEDVSWIPEAVLDVAYYLRKHKFNGYDPRYLKDGDTPRKELYGKFPSPPLMNVHWEVTKNCAESFDDCLAYLKEKISRTVLPRHLDSLTVIKHNRWTMDRDSDLIRATDDACLQLRDRDEKSFNVFESPIKKFQWLTSASYYMCWYAMREVPHLATFSDDCDNYANCIDWTTGPSNGDIRAKNEVPFACAEYSFCPDPCCPARHVPTASACKPVSPCGPKDKLCEIHRPENVDLESIAMNHWNVTCPCDVPGTRWDSKSGMCVDVDECVELPQVCVAPERSCLNYPGGYVCVCSATGYIDDGAGNCVVDPVLREVLHPQRKNAPQKEKTVAESFFDFVYHLKATLAAADEKADDGAA